MLKPALIGGVVAGIVSSIPCVNIGCCLWGLGGGFLAAYLAGKAGPNMSPGEGVKVGAFAGAIAGAISGTLSALINLVMSSGGGMFDKLPPEQAEKIPAFLRAGGGGAAAAFMSFFVFLVILGITGLLGGLIGGAVFSSSKGAPAANS